MKVSDLVPYFTRFNEYVWCIITKIERDTSTNNYKVYGMKDTNYNIEEITITNLKYYNDKVIPDQTDKGHKFDENYIFEKYYI